MNTSALLPSRKRDEFGSPKGIVFNCSKTATRVTKAMIGAKVITLCFAMFALYLEFGARTRPQDLRPIFFTETGLKFLIL